MEQNSKKPITLKSLYSMVIDCAVSGYLCVDYQRFGLSYLSNPKYSLYINTYIANGYIKVRLDKKHNWLIGKYG